MFGYEMLQTTPKLPVDDFLKLTDMTRQSQFSEMLQEEEKNRRKKKKKKKKGCVNEDEKGYMANETKGKVLPVRVDNADVNRRSVDKMDEQRTQYREENAG